MGKKKECVDCGDIKPMPFYEDPRDPPLEEGKCLCKDCRVSALLQEQDEMERTLAGIKKEIRSLLR